MPELDAALELLELDLDEAERRLARARDTLRMMRAAMKNATKEPAPVPPAPVAEAVARPPSPPQPKRAPPGFWRDHLRRILSGGPMTLLDMLDVLETEGLEVSEPTLYAELRRYRTDFREAGTVPPRSDGRGNPRILWALAEPQKEAAA